MLGLPPLSRGMCLLAGGVFLFFSPRPAYSVGAYDDLSSYSAFIRAPAFGTLGGRTTFIRGDGEEASLFYLEGNYPVGPRGLFQMEIPWVALSLADSVAADFGDIRFRVRLGAWRRPGHVLQFYFALRTGSGSSSFFPYMTSSIDIEGGFAYVDTIGPASWWASATGTVVTRLDDNIEEAGLYSSFVAANAGLVWALDDFDVEAGGGGYFYQQGGSRGLYFADVTFRYSPAVHVRLMYQAEFGSSRRRPYDYAVGVGITVWF